MNTIELISECCKKNPRAQKMLYDKYSKMLMGITYRYFLKKEDAEDVLSESFIKIFVNIHKFDVTQFNNQNEDVKGEYTDKLFACWARTIMINSIIDKIRKNKLIYTFEMLDSEEHCLITTENNGNRRDFDLLLKSIRRLPIKLRTMFNLKVIDGHTYKEISEKLNMNENTVKVSILRAKQILKERIKYEHFV